MKKLLIALLMFTAGSAVSASEVVELLTSENWRDRKNAVELISGTDLDDKVGLVSGMLQDTRDDVRLAAVKALVEIGGYDIIEPLTEALNDGRNYIRSAALGGLIPFGDEAGDAFRIALEDSDSSIRMAALAAAAVLPSEKALELLSAVRNDREKSIRLALVEYVYSISYKTVELFPQTIRMLGEAVRDSDREIRLLAISSLASRGGELAAQMLSSGLESSDVRTRAAAVEALGVIAAEIAALSGNEEVLAPTLSLLGQALEDSDRNIRRAAVGYIYDISYKSVELFPQAIRLLGEAVGDSDREIRLFTISSLSSRGGELAVEMTGAGMKSRDESTRAATVEGLGSMVPGMVAGRGNADNVVRHLAAGLSDRRYQIRKDSFRALQKIGSPASLKALAGAWNDSDHRIRADLVRHMSVRGDMTVVNELGNMLQDRDWNIRVNTVHALASIGDSASIDRICLALFDSDREVRRAAVESLRILNSPRSVNSIGKMMIADRQFRQDAAEVLGAIGHRGALGFLLEVLPGEKGETRAAIEVAIGQIIEARHK